MTKLDPEATKRTLRRLHGEAQGVPTEGPPETERPVAERAERLWRALEPPPATPPPPDFAARTVEGLRRRQAGNSWSPAPLSPAWARGAAAAALAAGLLLGMGVGSRVSAPAEDSAVLGVDAQATNSAGPGDVWSEEWTEEDWAEAWSLAVESSFGPQGRSGDGS